MSTSLITVLLVILFGSTSTLDLCMLMFEIVMIDVLDLNSKLSTFTIILVCVGRRVMVKSNLQIEELPSRFYPKQLEIC